MGCEWTITSVLTITAVVINKSFVPIGYGGTEQMSKRIFDTDGAMHSDVSLSMRDLKFEIHTFYQNDDTNLSHIYSDYDFYTTHTMTNTYTVTDNVALVQQVDFIRSTLLFVEGENEGEYLWKRPTGQT